MYGFINDYSEGAHPRVLEALIRTNMEQTVGYGEDAYCAEARELIRQRIGREDAAVHFLMGGTQTNLTAIAAALRPHQGVVAAVSAHVNNHEAGAIEACGHKVIALPSPDGKVTAAAVEELLDIYRTDPSWEHIVQPGMVYISHPTEIGTVYTLSELTALSETCRKNGLPLYVDGARLACALGGNVSDVTIEDLARLTDMFYIGGTKHGLLFGEALVILDGALKRDFRSIQKQKGGLGAKGRLLGVQYTELFRDGLYYDIGRHEVDMARRLTAGLREAGCRFFADSPTNQVFIILEKTKIAELEKQFGFEFWCRHDAKSDVIRFCTSWATPPEQVNALVAAVKAL